MLNLYILLELKSLKSLVNHILNKTTFSSVFFLKLISAIGGISIIAFIGNFYTLEDIGTFALYNSLIMLVSVISLLGNDISIIKKIANEESIIIQKRILYYYLSRATLISILVSFLLLIIFHLTPILKPLFSIYIFHLICLSIFYFAIFPLISGYLKGKGFYNLSIVFDITFISFITSFFGIVLNSFFSIDFNIFMTLFAFVGFICILIFIIFEFKDVKKYINQLLLIENKDYFNKDFSVISIFGYLQPIFGLFIVGIMLDVLSVGIIRVVTQIANSSTFILVVLNTILPNQLSSLYYKKDLIGFNKLISKSIKLAFFISLPLVIILFSFPEGTLLLFNENMQGYGYLIQIIMAAQILNITFGISGNVLMMTSNETEMKKNVMITNILYACLIFFFVQYLSILGFILLTSLLLVLIILLNIYSLKKVLNLNIFSLLINSQKHY